MFKLTRLMIVIAVFFLQSITSNIYASADNQIELLNERLNGCSVVEEVRELIGRGANVNSVIRGIAPLHYAAENGRLDIVRELILHEANVNVRDYRQDTPLHYAAREGYMAVACELINSGAKVNILSNGNNTPLHRAALVGRFEMVKFLIELGADAEMKNKGGKTPADVAREEGYDDIVKYIHDWNDFSEIKGAVEE